MNEDDDDDDNSTRIFQTFLTKCYRKNESDEFISCLCTIPNLVNAYQMSENEGFEPIVIAQKKYEPDYGWKGV